MNGTARRARRITAAAAFGGLALLTGLVGRAGAAGEDVAAPDHSAFDRLLERYVTASGVRYAAWAKQPQDQEALDAYLVRMAAERPTKLARDDRLAYWINVYNALTLDLVLDHYPVSSIKSIHRLRSPWKQKLFEVEGRTLSLNEIENDIVRPEFHEPRIHFALNCAAVSCPPLRAGAFGGEALDAQLEERTRTFLGDPERNGLDAKGRLVLSRILDWYRDDFEADGRMIDWLRPYLAAGPGLPADPEIRFADYDWSLNEAP